MNDSSVYFFYEETSFRLVSPDKYINWLLTIAQEFDTKIDSLNYIFCSDNYLHAVNLKYLNHDTFTDIITFEHDAAHGLSADIFISADRVKENAKEFGSSFDDELARVIAHGLLHLLGYNDKTEEESKEMRKKEDACLSLRQF